MFLESLPTKRAKLEVQISGTLQLIGKIDGPPEVVIFLHICKIGIFGFLSIYMESADIWFSDMISQEN